MFWNLCPVLLWSIVQMIHFWEFHWSRFFKDTAHTACVNHRVRDIFTVLNVCIKGFELIWGISRDSCRIAIRLTIIVGISDLIIELMVTSYVVNRFLLVIWWWLCQFWLTFVSWGCKGWACGSLGLRHFLAKWSIIPQLLHFLAFAG